MLIFDCFMFVDSRVFVHGCAATPTALLTALSEYGKRVSLRDVEMIHIHTEGELISSDPENEGMWGWAHGGGAHLI